MDGIVYCDFDGTLVNGNIEADFIRWLAKSKKIAFSNFLCAMVSLPVNFLRKMIYKGNVFSAWSAFSTVQARQELFDTYIETCLLSINEVVFDKLQSWRNKYEIILLTGSNEKLVSMFLKKNGLHNFFSSVIGGRLSKNGFIVLQNPFGKDKLKYLIDCPKKIGVANEYADSFYLKRCDDVFVVNPEKKLYRLAIGNNWEVI